ncbi:hypothetical protein ILUMI_06591 [Ignelater luminosus]|uniref:Uncharacterized protein n=1 Tax=Ignelater luminosus TaxID=2038154 RepID=A0A8K0DAD5_IGNLU|nr:hypothetical protein ILUMI_06591 [Ignelater luminosus]
MGSNKPVVEHFFIIYEDLIDRYTVTYRHSAFTTVTKLVFRFFLKHSPKLYRPREYASYRIMHAVNDVGPPLKNVTRAIGMGAMLSLGMDTKRSVHHLVQEVR